MWSLSIKNQEVGYWEDVCEMWHVYTHTRSVLPKCIIPITPCASLSLNYSPALLHAMLHLICPSSRAQGETRFSGTYCITEWKPRMPSEKHSWFFEERPSKGRWFVSKRRIWPLVLFHSVFKNSACAWICVYNSGAWVLEFRSVCSGFRWLKHFWELILILEKIETFKLRSSFIHAFDCSLNEYLLLHFLCQILFWVSEKLLGRKKQVRNTGLCSDGGD